MAVTFSFFAWHLSSGAPFALVQTETFTVVAVCQWFKALNCRSELNSACSLSLFKNTSFVVGLALDSALQFAVVYAEPMKRVFHTVPIPLADFFLIGVVASVGLWVEEIRKSYARRRLGNETNRIAASGRP